VLVVLYLINKKIKYTLMIHNRQDDESAHSRSREEKPPIPSLTHFQQ
jgi:hypothetical protein